MSTVGSSTASGKRGPELKIMREDTDRAVEPTSVEPRTPSRRSNAPPSDHLAIIRRMNRTAIVFRVVGRLPCKFAKSGAIRSRPCPESLSVKPRSTLRALWVIEPIRSFASEAARLRAPKARPVGKLHLSFRHAVMGRVFACEHPRAHGCLRSTPRRRRLSAGISGFRSRFDGREPGGPASRSPTPSSRAIPDARFISCRDACSRICRRSSRGRR